MRARRASLRLARIAAVIVLGVLAQATEVSLFYNAITTAPDATPRRDDHSHFVRTGDLMTHYEQWGSAGTAIVLVHGFAESSGVWQLVAQRLATSHRVYAMDVRGYGYTERTGPYTLASDTDQLAAFLTALGLDQAHHDLPVLVGHSSGAAIVGSLALRDPHAARLIVFLDGDGTPYGVGPAWLHSLVVDPYATSAIRFVLSHASLARAVYHRTCGPDCPPFDEDLWLTPLRVRGAEEALKAIARRPLIGLTFAQEQRITTPAAIIYGSGDDTMPSADAQATALRLRTAGVYRIAGARHLPMVSAPDEVTRLLLKLADTP